MEQYIDKDAVVAEIENRIKELQKSHKENEEKLDFIQKTSILLCIDECKVILSLINTLEVKEVDLEKEVDAWRHNHFHGRRDKNAAGEYLERISQLELAKHFFEFGIKLSNRLTWEDMKQIHDIMVECSAIGLWSKPDEEYYQEVVKRFEIQKGEGA